MKISCFALFIILNLSIHMAWADNCQQYLNLIAENERLAAGATPHDATYFRQAAQNYRNAYNAQCTGGGSSNYSGGGNYSGGSNALGAAGAVLGIFGALANMSAAQEEQERQQREAAMQQYQNQMALQRLQEQQKAAEEQAEKDRIAAEVKAKDDQARQALDNPFGSAGDAGAHPDNPFAKNTETDNAGFSTSKQGISPECQKSSNPSMCDLLEDTSDPNKIDRSIAIPENDISDFRKKVPGASYFSSQGGYDIYLKVTENDCRMNGGIPYGYPDNSTNPPTMGCNVPSKVTELNTPENQANITTNSPKFPNPKDANYSSPPVGEYPVGRSVPYIPGKSDTESPVGEPCWEGASPPNPNTPIKECPGNSASKGGSPNIQNPNNPFAKNNGSSVKNTRSNNDNPFDKPPPLAEGCLLVGETKIISGLGIGSCFRKDGSESHYRSTMIKSSNTTGCPREIEFQYYDVDDKTVEYFFTPLNVLTCGESPQHIGIRQ